VSAHRCVRIIVRLCVLQGVREPGGCAWGLQMGLVLNSLLKKEGPLPQASEVMKALGLTPSYPKLRSYNLLRLYRCDS
jgi:hypothetical protein